MVIHRRFMLPEMKIKITVALVKSNTCVIRILMPELSDVVFHFHLTIFYVCILHCVIQHPYYSDTNFSPSACWIRQVLM